MAAPTFEHRVKFLEIRLQDTYILHVVSVLNRVRKKQRRIQPQSDIPEKIWRKNRYLIVSHSVKRGEKNFFIQFDNKQSSHDFEDMDNV